MARRKRINPQQLKAVNYFMQGMSKGAALRKAGYSDTTSTNNPQAIFEQPVVKEEIERQLERLRKRNVGRVERIKDELDRIAFFNIGEIAELDEDGSWVFDWDQVNLDHLAALGEVKVVETTEVKDGQRVLKKRVFVKPYDKLAALNTLSRIEGMFNDKLAIVDGASLVERLQAGRRRLNQEENEDD